MKNPLSFRTWTCLLILILIRNYYHNNKLLFATTLIWIISSAQEFVVNKECVDIFLYRNCQKQSIKKKFISFFQCLSSEIFIQFWRVCQRTALNSFFIVCDNVYRKNVIGKSYVAFHHLAEIVRQNASIEA